MSEALAVRLAAIDWPAHQTAYGPAGQVPQQLKRLLEGHEEAALQAAHDLWCGLCHQHAYISSAALPAFPFLMEALSSRSDAVKVEVMDILVGFAECSSAQHPESPLPWVTELRRMIADASSRFQELQSHPNENIRDWAGRILESLGIQGRGGA